MHLNILDQKRIDILPLLKNFKDDGFYLAGGTGLALQLGHRDSIDFDFFKKGNYDTVHFIEKLQNVFSSHSLVITQEEKNTVSCVIDNSIQLSFFGYQYDLVLPLLETEYLSIASILDIGCMKCSAVTSRSLEKDYVDLYFILQNVSLVDLIEKTKIKLPLQDSALILKSLVYFDDVTKEEILFKENHEISFEEVKIFLQKVVRDYF